VSFPVTRLTSQDKNLKSRRAKKCSRRRDSAHCQSLRLFADEMWISVRCVLTVIFLNLWTVQKLINRSVVPMLLDCLDHCSLITLAMPPLLVIIDNCTMEDYQTFISHDVNKLLTSPLRPIQVCLHYYTLIIDLKCSFAKS